MSLGVDLVQGPNKHFDRFSKPDVSVEVRHNSKVETTPIESNTFKPRFMWSCKFPYDVPKRRTRTPRIKERESRYGGGFLFTVWENNVILGNHVMGRAFITTEEAERAMEDDVACLVSIGESIGNIKVKLYNPQKIKTTIPLNNDAEEIIPKVSITNTH